MSMNDDIRAVLVSEQQLKDKVAQLGAQISQDYAGKDLVLVSILKGAVVFMADLMRAVTIPCSIDFMVVSSYGAGTTTTGLVKIIKDLDSDRRRADIQADYTGFQVPDEFVVGYGLDYDEKYRNLPYVGVLKPSVYEK